MNPSAPPHHAQKSTVKLPTYRWRIAALLFLATTINHLDRQVLGILAPQLQQAYGITESQYGLIVSVFQASFALGLLSAGWLLDRFGIRLIYALAMLLWSLSDMAHALGRGALSFGLVRAGLGFGEAGNFPAFVKVLGEWFPLKERAFAAGLVNSGANVGAIVAPLLVPWLALNFGWQWAFLGTGLIGFGWLALWLGTYRPPRQHPRLSAPELAYIEAGYASSAPLEAAPRGSYRTLLGLRATWGVALARLCTDPVWWIFLYWTPKFLSKTHGLNLATLGLPLLTIYLVADLGSIGGGWVSSYLLKRGRSLTFARKATMLGAGLCVVPIFFASRTADLPTAVALLSLAVAGHQAWAANIFTLHSDLFPQRLVGSATGLTGMIGAVGGMLVAPVVGAVLDLTGSYQLIFTAASLAYLLGWGLLHWLVPVVRPVGG